MSTVRMSDDITQLVLALNAFQSEVVTVERTVTNPFFRSKYADLSSIMLESQPVLTKHGLSVAQFPDTLDSQPALTTILMHNSGQFIGATAPLPVSKVRSVTKKEKTQKSDEKEIISEGFDPQEFGRAITYMRRYGYAAVLQIVIDEDDDGNKSSKVINDFSDPNLVEKIKAIWKEAGGTDEQLVVWVKKNNNDMLLENIPRSRQQALLQVLEAKKAEKQAKDPPTETTQPELAEKPVETSST